MDTEEKEENGDASSVMVRVCSMTRGALAVRKEGKTVVPYCWAADAPPTVYQGWYAHLERMACEKARRRRVVVVAVILNEDEQKLSGGVGGKGEGVSVCASGWKRWGSDSGGQDRVDKTKARRPGRAPAKGHSGACITSFPFLSFFLSSSLHTIHPPLPRAYLEAP